MSAQPEVSIVMPCLNEAEALGTCLELARRGLESAGVDGEIVVADNGSTDGSQEIARELGARVVDVEEKGYGAALAGGFKAARGRYVVMGDADGSYDFAAIGPFVERLRSGADLVMGNRFKGGIERGAMPFLHRYLGNPVLSGLGRLFFRTPIGDFHCGLRAFHRDILPRLNLQSPGMEFASEMVVKASLYGLTVSEVPTTLSRDLRQRKPHLRTWRDGWRHLRFLLLFSPRWLFLYPGIALMLVGLVLTGAVLPGELEIGGARFDVHTLVYGCAFIVIGFAAVTFSVLARTYAMSEEFLPATRRFRSQLDLITLETGLALGGALVLAGFALSLTAFFTWGRSDFESLNYRDTMRVVVPAVTLLIVGFQAMLFSFLLSFLNIKHRPPDSAAAPEGDAGPASS